MGGLIEIRRTCICCFWKTPRYRLSCRLGEDGMTEVVRQSRGLTL
jgi:hypothetical protein